MTVQLARAFLDLLWLAGTLNLGQTCNSDPRTKIEASSVSIPWWQCIAVALGRARCTDCYTDVYNIITCFHVMHTRACVIIRECISFPF